MVKEQYIKIPLQDCKSGLNEFDFEPDTAFFTQYEESEMKGGSVVMEIDLVKYSTYIELELRFDGFVIVACDRCLEDADIPVSGTYNLTIHLVEKLPSENEETDPDVMYIHPAEEILDLTHYCYESVSLSLPIQRFHGNDENGKSLCNPEMLKYLS